MKLSAKKFTARLAACALLVLAAAFCALPAFADGPDASAQTETAQTAAVDTTTSGKAMASGIAAAGGALAMGIAVAKSADSISRQPEAEGKIRTTLMLGLVFIETAIIYALLAVILIIFVL